MKLNRRHLRRLIESVINEQQDNPGDKFSSAVSQGNKSSSEQYVEKRRQALQKTYDWFIYDVFPAMDENQWPIVADDNYHVFDHEDTGEYDMIPKGTIFKSILDGVPSKQGGKPITRKLRDYWERLLSTIDYKNVRVDVESEQETAFEKAEREQKALDDRKSNEDEKLEKLGMQRESLSRGSMHRRRYRRY